MKRINTADVITVIETSLAVCRLNKWRHNDKREKTLLFKSLTYSLIIYSPPSSEVFILIFLQSNGRNNTPSRQPRSKSEGPPPMANGRCIIATENVSGGKQITEKVFYCLL